MDKFKANNTGFQFTPSNGHGAATNECWKKPGLTGRESRRKAMWHYPVDLKIDVEVSANMKKFREQMEKPDLPGSAERRKDSRTGSGRI
ncbi:hypothetical protein ABNB59_12220 [Paenibacillus larvae]|uniref:hypothetical protein n=1 Tax=Paenibacillus larvae TaxID=1464 RepID=UPI0012BA5C9D|nr:hypothetical protein [Paenibacillus larvae]MCY7476391.1 hypothetical protein [Paenibacillus larvae]MCY7491441.1 hypothetical protein [Paenibacillus larvae]MCY9510545.1 hypothetical protein [Paenibacillus larvae]MCY9525366.1 hypothetical protein [Paenibacillus larvae]MCY9565044.1 hypothetical protein [Paenibacillus larvae]